MVGLDHNIRRERVRRIGVRSINVQGSNAPEHTTTATNTAISSTTAEATNQPTVFPYSISLLSAIRRDRNSAIICITTATVKMPAARTERKLHCPSASNPQKRKKASE